MWLEAPIRSLGRLWTSSFRTDRSGPTPRTLYFPFDRGKSYLSQYGSFQPHIKCFWIDTYYEGDIDNEAGIPIPDTDWTISCPPVSVGSAGDYTVSAYFYDYGEGTSDTPDGQVTRSASVRVFEPIILTDLTYLGVENTANVYASNNPGISGGTYHWECSSNLRFVLSNSQLTQNTSVAAGYPVTVRGYGASSATDGDWIRVRYQPPADDMGRSTITPENAYAEDVLTCIMDLDIDNGQSGTLSETEEDSGSFNLPVGWANKWHLPLDYGMIPLNSVLRLEVTSGASLHAYVPGYGWSTVGGNPVEIGIANIPSGTQLWVLGENAGSSVVIQASIKNGGVTIGYDTVAMYVTN